MYSFNTVFLDYQYYFIQSRLRIERKKNLNFGLGLRYGHLVFTAAKIVGRIPQNFDKAYLSIEDRNQRGIMEASFQIQGGFNIMKAYVRANVILPTFRLNTPRVGRSVANVGIVLELDEVCKKVFRKKDLESQ